MPHGGQKPNASRDTALVALLHRNRPVPSYLRVDEGHSGEVSSGERS